MSKVKTLEDIITENTDLVPYIKDKLISKIRDLSSQTIDDIRKGHLTLSEAFKKRGLI